jgi:hypothetical protein
MASNAIDRLREGLETFNRTGEIRLEFLAPEFELHQASSIVDTAGVFHGPDGLRDFVVYEDPAEALSEVGLHE